MNAPTADDLDSLAGPRLSELYASTQVGHLLFLSRACAAIAAAWQEWQARAALADATVNGPIASGGHVDSLDLGVSLLNQLGAVPAPLEYGTPAIARAIAVGVGVAWRRWTDSLSVPNLPWFPTFLAAPAPRTPPTAALPAPLILLSPAPDSLTEDAIAAEVKHADPRKFIGSGARVPYHQAIGRAIAVRFGEWRRRGLLTRIWGEGPVAASHFMPIGPVVDGRAWSEPGGLV